MVDVEAFTKRLRSDMEKAKKDAESVDRVIHDKKGNRIYTHTRVTTRKGKDMLVDKAEIWYDIISESEDEIVAKGYEYVKNEPRGTNEPYWLRTNHKIEYVFAKVLVKDMRRQ